MAKAKHQRQKSNKQLKQSHVKKGGKQADTSSELKAQLDALGLKIIQVTADGNCFFRALADQLEGNEDEHEKYRSMVARFIEKSREMFEPFVEDEVPFDEYCRSIGEDGTWAGNMELQAASLVTRINICIHRFQSPRWYIQNFDINEARMIHLSYHDGEHYNSVRSRDDNCCGPATPIVIKGDADLSEKSNESKADAMKSTREGERKGVHSKSIDIVKCGSGCEDARKVEQALQKVGGNVDAAIDVLLEEQESEYLKVSQDDFSHSVDISFDGSHDKSSEVNSVNVQENACKQDSSSMVNKNNGENCPPPAEKKISRNKACQCGSKKKYKSCCGSVSGKSPGRFPVIQSVDYIHNRKGGKQGKKSGSTIVNSIQSNKGLPDVGAICI